MLANGSDLATALITIIQTEQDRSERFDEVLREYFFNDTVLVQGFPIGQTGNDEESPVVLDCGCASGAWITQFLDDRDGDVRCKRSDPASRIC